ncbi:hypothetical protein L7F22_027471 [Adiantum nelumboides]|nr:hypothetical protein [Adiantum nelumboides]
MYLDVRYVSASEACWRIFEFPLHSDAPDVQRLSVHVPSGQMVTFQDHDRLGDVLQRDTLEKTTLTEWFACNVENPEANDTLYIDFPNKWVWNSSSKKWTKRRRGDTIGRMYFVQPSAGERYYVRLLLTICKGFAKIVEAHDDVAEVKGDASKDKSTLQKSTRGGRQKQSLPRRSKRLTIVAFNADNEDVGINTFMKKSTPDVKKEF